MLEALDHYLAESNSQILVVLPVKDERDKDTHRKPRTVLLMESFEPTAKKYFTLEVKAKDAVKVQPRIESLLRRRRVKFELRESAPEEISYEVQLPLELKTDTLSAEIMELDADKGTAVNWSPEKKKSA